MRAVGRAGLRTWALPVVGATGAAGSASYGAGTFTVQGAGADIWGTSDAFQYVNQPLAGDGQIVARVTSLMNTHRHRSEERRVGKAGRSQWAPWREKVPHA